MYANAGHGRSDGAHAEGQHVHGAALHAALEELLQTAAHDVWIFPVIGGAGGVARERTDKRAVFDAGNVIRCRAGVVASGPFFLIEAGEGSGINEAIAEEVVFRPGAIDPVDGIGAAKLRHFFDPSNQVFVGGWRSLEVGRLVVENGLLHFSMVLLRCLSLTGYRNCRSSESGRIQMFWTQQFIAAHAPEFVI